MNVPTVGALTNIIFQRVSESNSVPLGSSGASTGQLRLCGERADGTHVTGASHVGPSAPLVVPAEVHSFLFCDEEGQVELPFRVAQIHILGAVSKVRKTNNS